MKSHAFITKNNANITITKKALYKVKIYNYQ